MVRSASPRRSRLRAGAIVAFASLALALAGAVGLVTPASAASSGVLLSPDGVNFSDGFSGSLFDSTALMVPHSTQTGRFWVKNGSSEPAYLRVSVKAVGGTGSAFSGAMSLKASTPSSAGSNVGVDAALPCHVLNQGQVMAPGAVVRIDAVLTLGDLTGTTGQQSNVRFDILAGLSSAATGTMPATTCLAGSGTVPGTPAGGSGGSGTPHTGGPRSSAPAAVAGDADGVIDMPLPSFFPFGDGAGGAHILLANTGVFLEAWFWLLWGVLALAIGAVTIMIGRVRAHHEEEREAARWHADV